MSFKSTEPNVSQSTTLPLGPYLSALWNYADVHGRASRLEYIGFLAPAVALYVLASWFDQLAGYDVSGLGYRHLTLAFHFLPMAVLIRRFNDTGIPRDLLLLPVLAIVIARLARVTLALLGIDFSGIAHLTIIGALWAYLLIPVIIAFIPSRSES